MEYYFLLPTKSKSIYVSLQTLIHNVFNVQL